MTAGDSPAAGDGDPPENLTLAQKIDRVWLTMHPKDRGPWTYPEVVAGVKALGVTVSASYLWHLRNGVRTNPTVNQIEALATFFHVPVSYFFGTTAEVENVDAQLVLVEAMRSPELRDLALRASTLSPAGMRAIAHMIEDIQTVQGMSTRRDKSRKPAELPPLPESEGGDTES